MSRNYKALHEVIMKIKETSGSNDKKIILEAHTGNDEFKEYFLYVYDLVNKVYGKTKLPTIAEVDYIVENDDWLEEMYSILDEMAAKDLKGKDADSRMQDFLTGAPQEIKDLMFWVLQRDVKAKIGVTLINEAMGKFIQISPYMRCESEKMFDKRIKFVNEHGQPTQVLVQTKADGAFLNTCISKDFDTVDTSTRYGRKGPTDNKFINSLSKITDFTENDNSTIHGEFLLKDKDGKVMIRETGNGRINSYFKKEEWLKEYDKKIQKAKTPKASAKLEKELQEHLDDWNYTSRNLVYKVWDILPTEDWLNLYYDKELTFKRFLNIKEYVSRYNKYIESVNIDIDNCELQIINHKFVNSVDEAMTFYQEQLDLGEEGMVAKMDTPWENGTNTKGCIKLKDFKECDLVIIGYNEADEHSDFAGGIGSYICESSDGILKVNISGMKRHQRGLIPVDENDSSKGLKLIEDFDFEEHIGKVIAVKYNELTKNKDTGVPSLFLPSILEIRESSDKVIADDFDKIVSDSKKRKK